MPEGLSFSKKQDHLDLKIEGARPIIACVGKAEDYYFDKKFQFLEIEESFTNSENHKVHKIDWINSPLQENNYLHQGTESYVVSPVDDFDKFSKNFFRCTGLIVAGVEKYTSKNISFLTHQDPAKFLYGTVKDKFISDLEKQLSEIKERCIPGTIDAVLVGGRYLKEDEKIDLSNDAVFTDYPESLELLGGEVKKVLGFEPIVINGPKTIDSVTPDDIYYKNDERKLYFIRPLVNEDMGDFKTSQFRG